MIFLASIHESLSVTSLIPRSEALSLIMMTAGVATAVVGGAGAGGEGSKDTESGRMEIVESASGWANGMKGDSREKKIMVPIPMQFFFLSLAVCLPEVDYPTEVLS